MNPKNLVSSTALSHCQFRSASSQRFCRMAVSDHESGLCLRHAALRKEDIAVRLIGDTGEFRSAVTINHSLGELYKLQARDEITPRRAAVMAYTCNLLLRTLPAIEHELNPQSDDESQQIIIDLPRPKRD